ncbi:MAG: 1-deoxy-D-xylulose-5-phosphate synthase [Gammaproteobacteria bacterium]|nr:1-deoxy-D-xylulose-5-phosphate synthase [Gammaproteobacteria bacterium]
MLTSKFPLLDRIQLPADLRQLSPGKLVPLAAEVRQFMIEALDQCGGHFAANLGTVELAIALHYLYNTPEDDIIWDVGHQAYPHKILTGRKNQLHTIRQSGGLTPFQCRTESEYDAFGGGHSSTSISAALGMAIAAQLKNETRRSIAVIGDGGMTSGMAFEALNHAGALKADVLVILNDNDMSISHNVGALNNYFARIWSGKIYTTFRKGSKRVLKKMPPMWGELMRRTEEHLKGMVAPGTLFEELGFNYIGPIDGHDLPLLLTMLGNIKKLSGPQFLHIITKKGKGYAPAEADPIKYHAVAPGFYSKPDVVKSKTTTYSNIFGDWLCEMAAQDQNIVAITPAMGEGSDLLKFSQEFPERYFDVAIAEQHSVTLAAGMACQGLKPVVAIYSTFLQRAYDQMIHDVAIQKLPVLFAIDRGGLVGGDGVTHNGAFDLSYMRSIPNLMIMAPADENELRNMLYTGYLFNGPAAVRYPRGKVRGVAISNTMQQLPIGKAELVRQGKRVAMLSFGAMLTSTLEVAAQIDATVVNMRFVKPLDIEMIKQLSASHELLVTLEENVILGGVGSGVGEVLAAENISIPLLNLGLPDQFIEHGEPSKLLADLGLDAAGIKQSILNKLNSLRHSSGSRDPEKDGSLLSQG